MKNTARRLGLGVAAVALLAGCSGNTKVGSGVKVSGQAASGCLNIGCETTTTAAASATTRPAPTTAPPTTARPVVTAPPTTSARVTTTTASANVVTINIYSDTSGKNQFEPSQQAVYVGTTVRWVNNDPLARSVVATNGAFRSPSIPGGGSWTYVASTAGQFPYQDGTRPYATGTLIVQAR